ncbi:hypothetical protein [Brumimicrobium mesophilum]|uniref:hypothetical protein n=1 Tax=Brumimicrobium mesophilum TaxID=392717 RepID=UPI000D140CD1|nr:hypothetical protein [Brumimicrobium mesophilum]
MKSSTEDLIRVARGNAMEDFKLRFMQKWYGNKPCFHYKEINLSNELNELLITKHPSIWFFSNSEEVDLEDKIWEKKELHNFLIFDWIDEGIESMENVEIKTWLENNIKTAMKLFESDQDDLVLCYHEGTLPSSNEWRSHFEKQLKV